MALNSSSTLAPTSPLTSAVLAYLTLIYEHLSGWTLGLLDLLLQRTNSMVFGIRQVNLVIEIVLSNYVVCTEEAAQRLDDYIEMQGARVDLVGTEDERAYGLWEIFNVIPQYERLEAQLDRAKKQMEAFVQKVADLAPTETDEKAYEYLKSRIGSYLGQ